ncbi:MAG: hypothetical protein ACXWM7_05165 [Parachlamydiaceae bacterium]
MVDGFGDHPEKWLATSSFWSARKEQITRQDNTALSFGYMSHEILSNNGIAILIMPGVFFVGSTAKLRDHLQPKIIAYAPQTRNIDFESVDPSQNYGIVAFKKDPRKGPIRVYCDLDSDRLNSFEVDTRVVNFPANRKSNLDGGDEIFATNTLLPLFGAQADHDNLIEHIENTTPTDLWSKGKKGNSIGGQDLGKFGIVIDENIALFACPENRGNSAKILSLVGISAKNYEKCSHKVILLDTRNLEAEKRRKLLEMLNSDSYNRILATLRTSKSLQSATLNMLGLPAMRLTQKELKNRAEGLLKKVRTKKRKSA